jgi:tRNA (mo5U34)-methyltransferase
MVFQTLTMPGDEVVSPPQNFSIDERELMLQPGWPKMAFIENELAGDPTNWWAANHACVDAMLRSAGLRTIARPGHEMYVCAPSPVPKERGVDPEEFRAATGPSVTTVRRRPSGAMR